MKKHFIALAALAALATTALIEDVKAADLDVPAIQKQLDTIKTDTTLMAEDCAMIARTPARDGALDLYAEERRWLGCKTYLTSRNALAAMGPVDEIPWDLGQARLHTQFATRYVEAAHVMGDHRFMHMANDEYAKVFAALGGM